MGLWQRFIASRSVLALNVTDWFVGAAGLDGKILGWIMHPAIAISILSISTLLIFEHFRDRWKSGSLYGEPTVSLGLKSPPPLVRGTRPVEPVDRRVVDPPDVTPRGGDTFALEIQYPATGSYYGYGWISGKGVSREELFHLYWEGQHHKQEGETATIKIAELSSGIHRELLVWGTRHNGSPEIVHKVRLWNGRIGNLEPHECLEIRVRIRTRGVAESWDHCYRFRMKKYRFEIDEVHNVGGGGRSLCLRPTGPTGPYSMATT